MKPKKRSAWDHIRADRYFHTVVSSNLRRVYYSIKFKTLVVEFQSSPGKLWLYPDVSVTLWKRLMRAESKGKYFAYNIRDTHVGYPMEIEMPEEPTVPLIYQMTESIKMMNERRKVS